MKTKINLALAHMGGREQEFIKEAFDTNWVTPLGPNVDSFEKSLSDYLGEQQYVTALSTGTSAIHLGLILLNVQADDEVICQSFTFAASANPIVYQGAKPVFVDSEKDTWNMDPELLELAIEDRLRITGRLPKAIIPVHLYGMPARMDEICEIADRYGIPILEDAAEALGSEYKGHKCGTIGNMGIFSFNGNKIITTSGGGALACRTQELQRQAQFYATQARETAPYYHHKAVGYNYRMSNVCAGIGRGQMMVLDEHVRRRREICQIYTTELADVPGIEVKRNPSEAFDSNFWLTCILVEPSKAGFTCDDVRLHLENENIESRYLWKPMHLQPVYADAPRYVRGVSEYLFDTGLCLPSSSMLSDDDIYRVADCIKSLAVK
ncbi:MAG: aminotransferase class I/II-fold pyridoxal phosphate-dependent enzyme [Mediterranea sp.]|jgi:dTDP-4-amino-4,6-dideoxygalactose transaminase|nr:aminotransferase class I/II-fold pyridoxal phosphate-dependent enzyme [Mediterranea sp.]